MLAALRAEVKAARANVSAVRRRERDAVVSRQRCSGRLSFSSFAPSSVVFIHSTGMFSRLACCRPLFLPALCPAAAAAEGGAGVALPVFLSAERGRKAKRDDTAAAADTTFVSLLRLKSIASLTHSRPSPPSVSLHPCPLLLRRSRASASTTSAARPHSGKPAASCAPDKAPAGSPASATCPLAFLQTPPVARLRGHVLSRPLSLLSPLSPLCLRRRDGGAGAAGEPAPRCAVPVCSLAWRTAAP